MELIATRDHTFRPAAYALAHILQDAQAHLLDHVRFVRADLALGDASLMDRAAFVAEIHRITDELLAPHDFPHPQDEPTLDLQGADLQSLSAAFREATECALRDKVDTRDESLANSNSNHDRLGRFSHSPGSRRSVRDFLGCKPASSMDPDENIRRGQKAVEFVLRTRRTVPDAMYRRGLGMIGFPYGRGGHKKPNNEGKTHTDGYGISHILAKHQAPAVKALPRVLAKGNISKHPKDPRKRIVLLGPWQAIIRKHAHRKSWVVTNYDQA